jgi:threonine dehydratase
MSESTMELPDEAEFDIDGARERIADLVIRTPVIRSDEASRRAERTVYLKLESLQVTGSFKVRGAANQIRALDADTRRRGILACSSGNHGKAVSWVCSQEGVPATICVPNWVDPVKLDAMRSAGAEVLLTGATYDESEARSFEIARQRKLTYVHPFDEPEGISGQGTIGLELLEDLDDMAVVVGPLGGGGLVAGLALAIKRVRPDVTVVAAWAERAQVMAASLQAGRTVTLPEEETIATALSGGIGPDNRHTFRLLQSLVDRLVPVSEREIRDAMRFAYEHHNLVLEGGAAVGLAAALGGGLEDTEGPIAVVVSGGNIDPDLFHRVLTSQEP